MNCKEIVSAPRRRFLAAASVALVASAAPVSGILAQEPSGELVILQWQGGTEAEMWQEVEEAFMAKHPGVTVREADGDGSGRYARPDAHRAAWRRGGGHHHQHLAGVPRRTDRCRHPAAGRRPVGSVRLGREARPGLEGPRLGRRQHLRRDLHLRRSLGRSGTSPRTSKRPASSLPRPGTSSSLRFDKLKAAGFAPPVAIGAKYWSHAEWFESLLLRTAGVEAAAKLAAHEIPWTDPVVKTALAEVCRDAGGRLLRRPRGDVRQRLGRGRRPGLQGGRLQLSAHRHVGERARAKTTTA